MSFAVDSHDSFSGLYNNVGGISDIKKLTVTNLYSLNQALFSLQIRTKNGEATNWFQQPEVDTGLLYPFVR